jgi:hypothetical protein
MHAPREATTLASLSPPRTILLQPRSKSALALGLAPKARFDIDCAWCVVVGEDEFASQLHRFSASGGIVRRVQRVRSSSTMSRASESMT